MKISFLFTCYNRKEKTLRCIKTILEALNLCEEKGLQTEGIWFITDGGSSDGSIDAVNELLKGSKLHVRVGGEDTFYSRGMRMCMESYMTSDEKCEYVFLINDDVNFYEDFLYKMISGVKENEVYVGATESSGIQSYGGVRYLKTPRGKRFLPRSVKYNMVKTDDSDRSCHTFNANCVMIPGSVMEQCGLMDGKYVHSLGDFDYGLCIFEKGYDIISTDYYVGSCANNSKEGTWMDRSLSRRERFKKLNGVKGAPTKYWFYYLKKHFGITTGFIHSVTPYIKIFLGR